MLFRAGSTWTATGIGRHAFTLAAPAIAMGGNVRVGFEDKSVSRKRGVGKIQGELVAKVVRIAKELGQRNRYLGRSTEDIEFES